MNPDVFPVILPILETGGTMEIISTVKPSRECIEDAQDNIFDHLLLVYNHSISKHYLYNTLQNMMPYQEAVAHLQVAKSVEAALEKPGGVSTLVIIGPRDSGKSMTCHALKWGLAVGDEQVVVLSVQQLATQEDTALYDLTSTARDRPQELPLAQKLLDAAKGDPPLILLIVDDVHLAPQIIPRLGSLLLCGFCTTQNGVYFKLGEKTTLLVVFTSDKYIDTMIDTAYQVVYSMPVYTRTSVF